MAKKANKALKCWVQFVKKVQREEKLSYPEAMKRAKQRKDKGEKWMKGGGDGDADDTGSDDLYNDSDSPMGDTEDADEGEESSELSGGRRRRRSRRRRGSRSRRGGRSRRRRGSRSRRTRRRR